jgi:hypothetical protein
MFRLIPLLLAFGCVSELTPLQEEIVLDYQIWIEESTNEVQEELDSFHHWDHNIGPLAKQSWESEYHLRDFRKKKVAAKARPATGDIYIDPETWYWKWIEKDYLLYKESAETCGNKGNGVMFAHKAAYAAYILCHENAHNIHIKSHKDVYLIGETCKQVRIHMASNWLENCNEEVWHEE